MISPRAVLDSSALLAWLREEPGALATEEALAGVVAINAVNWAEVLSKLFDLGHDPIEAGQRLVTRGILGSALLVWPLDESMALDIAKLRAETRAFGLSLGDRACIALGQRLQVPILTADRVWRELPLRVQIQLIR